MNSKIESGLPEIQERLKSCYLYLKGRGIIHTQQGIANKTRRTFTQLMTNVENLNSAFE